MSTFFNEEVNEELDKKSSDFYKFEEGKNQIRIVSPFVWGYKYNFKNSAEGAEKGYPFYKTDAPEVATNRSKLQIIAGMVVYDYRTEELKPLTIHQKAILNAIREYAENTKYGDPTGYDVVITKKGSGKETKYPTTIANPPEELSEKVKKAVADVAINLELYFEGKPVLEALTK